MDNIIKGKKISSKNKSKSSSLKSNKSNTSVLKESESNDTIDNIKNLEKVNNRNGKDSKDIKDKTIFIDLTNNGEKSCSPNDNEINNTYFPYNDVNSSLQNSSNNNSSPSTRLNCNDSTKERIKQKESIRELAHSLDEKAVENSEYKYNDDGFENKNNYNSTNRIRSIYMYGSSENTEKIVYNSNYNNNKYMDNNEKNNNNNKIEAFDSNGYKTYDNECLDTYYYRYYDRNANPNIIIRNDIPLEYYFNCFYFEREIEISGTVLYISIGNVFHKKYFNGELKVCYQLGGKNFFAKARSIYSQELLHSLEDSNPNTELDINRDNIDIPTFNEKDNKENMEIEDIYNKNKEEKDAECDFEADCCNENKSCQEKKNDDNNNKPNAYSQEDLRKTTYIRYINDKKITLEEFFNTHYEELKEVNKERMATQNLKDTKQSTNIEKELLGSFDSIINVTICKYNRLNEYNKSLSIGKLYHFNKQIALKSDFILSLETLITNYLLNNYRNNDDYENPIDINLISLDQKFELLSKFQVYKLPTLIEVGVHYNYNGTLHNANKTGLVNEAMTCYMNSMLQILNSITYFKKSIYSIPQNENTSCVYGLQRLFYELETNKNPVSTIFLIKSFGWSANQLSEQHDIQEFNLKLNDALEKKLKGTDSDGLFKYLFEGKTENYIKCKNVDYCSKREETFNDISLDVKGCDNIYDSLCNYIKEETLDGDNKYDAGSFGKQDADKGVRFKALPPILIFQLKRFEFNFMTCFLDKVNDRFVFDEEICLKNFVTEEGLEIDNDLDYILHGVVVHSGTINNGHYYCYINTHEDPNEYESENKKKETKPTWIKFNDESVRRCYKQEAISNNFGGKRDYFTVKEDGSISPVNIRSDCSAYILVYIKKSMLKEIIFDYKTTDIPPVVEDFIKKDLINVRNEMIERQIDENNIEITLLDKNFIKQHTELGIQPGFFDNNKSYNFYSPLNKYSFKLSFPRSLTLRNLVDFISEKTNINSKKLVLFKYDFILSRDLRTKNFFKLSSVINYDVSLSDYSTYSLRKKYGLIFYIGILNDFKINNISCINNSMSNNNIRVNGNSNEECSISIINYLNDKGEYDTNNVQIFENKDNYMINNLSDEERINYYRICVNKYFANNKNNNNNYLNAGSNSTTRKLRSFRRTNQNSNNNEVINEYAKISEENHFYFMNNKNTSSNEIYSSESRIYYNKLLDKQYKAAFESKIVEYDTSMEIENDNINNINNNSSNSNNNNKINDYICYNLVIIKSVEKSTNYIHNNIHNSLKIVDVLCIESSSVKYNTVIESQDLLNILETDPNDNNNINNNSIKYYHPITNINLTDIVEEESLNYYKNYFSKAIEANNTNNTSHNKEILSTITDHKNIKFFLRREICNFNEKIYNNKNNLIEIEKDDLIISSNQLNNAIILVPSFYFNKNFSNSNISSIEIQAKIYWESVNLDIERLYYKHYNDCYIHLLSRLKKKFGINICLTTKKDKNSNNIKSNNTMSLETESETKIENSSNIKDDKNNENSYDASKEEDLSVISKFKFDYNYTEKEISTKIYQILKHIPDIENYLSYGSRIMNLPTFVIDNHLEIHTLKDYFNNKSNDKNIKIEIDESLTDKVREESILPDYVCSKTDLEYKYKYYNKEHGNKFFKREVLLYDFYSNPICSVQLILMKNQTKIKNLISVLFSFIFDRIELFKIPDTVINALKEKYLNITNNKNNTENKYNESVSISDLNTNNVISDEAIRKNLLKHYICNFFKLILQHEDGIIAYEILVSKEKDFFEFTEKENYNFVYRLQPYPLIYTSEIDNNLNFQKAFFAFNTRDGKSACDPIVLYIDPEIKVHKLKLIIIDALSKVEKVKHNNISMSSLKFYTFNFGNNQIEKDRLLIDSRGEIFVKNYFGSSVWNLLAEFPAVDSNYIEEGNMIIK